MSVLVAMAVLVSSPLARAATDLADNAMEVKPLLNGMSIPPITVKMADGTPVSLQALVMQKPTIVLFYRGGWCPYCSRQLAGLKDIEADLVELGYQVLAISPQSVAMLQEQKLETEFAVNLLSDENLDAIAGFGIGFYLDEDTVAKYKGYGISLTQDSNGRAVLPAPAIFFVDQKGVVQMSYVNPDYKVRPSADLVLAVAKALRAEN
ncbi:AhpC/TSA family protein [Alteromonas aestuariivivens]|uniref:thioredoxin-dependent peroxiredoxin n=2 Tax=Alteromonas aestuariivivens TaxID=1938339 RepID=A0A3D8M7D5_9ALTE|nr:peroxiredoxin-like family protein [Alteromonas aestuariivivens]RDV25672.1 AhpC/TSA family protein [Alteromonas aestuariivivens]